MSKWKAVKEDGTTISACSYADVYHASHRAVKDDNYEHTWEVDE